MVQIDFNEARKIREKYPDAHIRRTASKYYAEESPKVMALIRRRADTGRDARYAGKAKRRKQP